MNPYDPRWWKPPPSACGRACPQRAPAAARPRIPQLRRFPGAAFPTSAPAALPEARATAGARSPASSAWCAAGSTKEGGRRCPPSRGARSATPARWAVAAAVCRHGRCRRLVGHRSQWPNARARRRAVRRWHPVRSGCRWPARPARRPGSARDGGNPHRQGFRRHAVSCATAPWWRCASVRMLSTAATAAI